jgi:neutral ceramidase
MWDAVTNFLSEPSPDDIACHHPKPILLMTGGASRPYTWTPHVLPTQIFTIGDAVIVGLPGEFTTMAGRRVRNDITSNFGSNRQVILSGLTNIYSSYVTTPEEYQIQRYEGASTLYGPHTLPLLMQQYQRIMTALVNGQSVAPGPTIPDERSSQMTFLTPVINDDSGTNNFGDCILQPRASYRRGEQVFCTFVSGNPRNNLQTDGSFFFVELQQPNGSWSTVATDANWYLSSSPIFTILFQERKLNFHKT